MIRGRGWTGFDAAALQEAMRRSNREFAALLGVETTTVNNWRSGLSTVKPRPLTQEILDTAYRQHATSEDRTRFKQIVAEGESVWRSRHPATPRQTPVPALAGPTDHADSPRQPAGGATDLTTRPQEMSECRAEAEGEDKVNRRQFGVSALSAIALTGTMAELPQQPLASAKRLPQQPLASGKPGFIRGGNFVRRACTPRRERCSQFGCSRGHGHRVDLRRHHALPNKISKESRW